MRDLLRPKCFRLGAPLDKRTPFETEIYRAGYKDKRALLKPIFLGSEPVVLSEEWHARGGDGVNHRVETLSARRLQQ